MPRHFGVNGPWVPACDDSLLLYTSLERGKVSRERLSKRRACRRACLGRRPDTSRTMNCMPIGLRSLGCPTAGFSPALAVPNRLTECNSCNDLAPETLTPAVGKLADPSKTRTTASVLGGGLPATALHACDHSPSPYRPTTTKRALWRLHFDHSPMNRAPGARPRRRAPRARGSVGPCNYWVAVKPQHTPGVLIAAPTVAQPASRPRFTPESGLQVLAAFPALALCSLYSLHQGVGGGSVSRPVCLANAGTTDPRACTNPD